MKSKPKLRAPAQDAIADQARNARAPSGLDSVSIRRVRRGDLDQVIAIDATVTGLEKRKYWNSVYRRYGVTGPAERQFLVADKLLAVPASHRQKQATIRL